MDIETVHGKNGITLEKVVIPYHVKDHTDTLHLRYVELRKDPLTGLFNRIQPFKKKINVDKTKYILLFNNNKNKCLFCRENLKSMLKYSVVDRFKIDRKEMGRSLIFVSDKLYSKYHAIAVLNIEKHTEFIDEVAFYDFLNTFKLIREFVNVNYTKDKSAKYVYVNLNHTLLAGASEQHIHFQVEQDSTPTNYHKFLLNNSVKYFMLYRSSIFEDYISSEIQIGERDIYSGKFVDWVASFSPFGDYDVIGLVKSFGIFTMSEINFEQFLKELYEFLVKYIKFTKNVAFNLSIIDTSFLKEPGLYPLIRIVSRVPNKALMTSLGYLETLHLESLSKTLPEETAEILRKAYE